jgi:uncharacterized protein YqcC (DUF446 family)
MIDSPKMQLIIRYIHPLAQVFAIAYRALIALTASHNSKNKLMLRIKGLNVNRLKLKNY